MSYRKLQKSIIASVKRIELLYKRKGILRNPFLLSGIILFLIVAVLSVDFFQRQMNLPDFFEENEEFAILELPPSEASLDKNVSSEVFSVISPSILSQDTEKLIASLLLNYRIKYATFYDNTYVSLFEPFLEEDVELDSSPHIDKIDGTKLAQQEALPFLTLGEWWYKEEQNGDVLFRWIEQLATLNLYIPENGLDSAPTILKFSAKHYPGDSPLDILVNGEKVESIYFSQVYSDAYVELTGLTEGKNIIEFSSPQRCRIPSNDDRRCISFAFTNISLVHKDQIPTEGIVWYNGFYLEENRNESNLGSFAQWMSTKADIQIFTLYPQRISMTFEAVSYAKARNFVIKKDEAELYQQVLPDGIAYQKVVFLLELEKGNNRIDLFSDGCEKPSLVEGNKDERCLSVQIQSFSYEAFL